MLTKQEAQILTMDILAKHTEGTGNGNVARAITARPIGGKLTAVIPSSPHPDVGYAVLLGGAQANHADDVIVLSLAEADVYFQMLGKMRS